MVLGGASEQDIVTSWAELSVRTCLRLDRVMVVDILGIFLTLLLVGKGGGEDGLDQLKQEELSKWYSRTDVLLTPWWDFTAFNGEDVVFQCGVYTGMKPQDFGLQWLDSSGSPVQTADNR